jgi:hypothetical protein
MIGVSDHHPSGKPANTRGLTDAPSFSEPKTPTRTTAPLLVVRRLRVGIRSSQLSQVIIQLSMCPELIDGRVYDALLSFVVPFAL